MAARAEEQHTLRDVLKDVGFFWAIYSVLVGIPSVIVLARSIGFERDLIQPLEMIIDGYGELFAMLGALVEPWAVPIYERIGERFDWSYEPHIYWRAIFVLQMLYPIFLLRYHGRRRPLRAAAYVLSVAPLILALSLAVGFAPARVAYDSAIVAAIAVFLLGKTMLLYGLFADSREYTSAGLTITSPLVGALLILWFAGAAQ